MNKQETIEDIIAEMRGPKFYPWGLGGFSVEMDLTPLANRLEAAWKRESVTAENPSAVGDSAKLREALEVLLNTMCNWDDHLPPVIREGELREAYRKAESALAAPPRNCDIGTVDEQTERFVDFTSLCFQSEVVRLVIKWAQMPYKEGEKE